MVIIIWEKYKDVKLPESGKNNLKRRYSVTADILSYRRCPRQYGYNARKNFSPARPLQEFVGIVIHQVLDRAHAHYAGKLDEKLKGTIPKDEDIRRYFEEVEESLKSSGIRAVSKRIRDNSLEVLQRFNRLEGPTLYRRVRDTEHRLEKDEEKYVIHGVVDVLVEDNEVESERNVEIWDYKGSRQPAGGKGGKKVMEDYEFQMLIYMYLYKIRNGFFPKRGILYFVGELGGDVPPTSRPTEAIITVEPDPDKLEKAIKSFLETADQIENSIKQESWEPPIDGAATASRATCDICDFRWTCKKEGEYYQKNFPIP